MNLEALIVLPQVTQAIRSRAIYVVRDRFAAPGFAQAMALSAASQSPAPRPARDCSYTVKEGDFLTRIVRDRLQENGQTVNNSTILEGMKRVAEANGIDDPDVIHPGQRLDLSTLEKMGTPTRAKTPGRGGRAVEPLARAGSVALPKSRGVRGTVPRSVAAALPSEAKGLPDAEDTPVWAGVLGAEAELSSDYGYRRDPFTGGRRFHHGIDLAVPTGTSVHSVDDGEVVFSGWQPGYGRVVIVRHAKGVESVYGHASRTLAKVGQQVAWGDTIALSGSSGRSTGPHLHLEIRRNGKAFNPVTYLDKSPVRLASNRAH